jgi:hypothetical protein
MDERRDWRRLVWGVALMSAGVFLLFVQLGGLPEWMRVYQWWGGIVVALGLITLLTARRAESVGSGVTFVLIGLWLVLVTNRMFGLSWYNSWPIALVSAGAGTIAHAIAAHWLPDTKPERRHRRRDENAEETHA